MKPGLHGSTFGGNAVACAASLEVLNILTSQRLAQIRRASAYLHKRLSHFYRYPSVQAIRQRGLMVGIELDVPGAPYVSLAREKGLIVNCTQGNVVRLLPPYFMTQKETDRALSLLASVFDELN
jgi:acetylornithine/succinyldiaminopimelate/putrescine aminotransferase